MTNVDPVKPDKIVIRCTTIEQFDQCMAQVKREYPFANSPYLILAPGCW